MNAKPCLSPEKTAFGVSGPSQVWFTGRKAHNKLDNADGPAVIWRDATTGTVIREEWWTDGQRDRADGPAFILRDATTGTVTCEEWWKHGERIDPRRSN